MKFKVEISKSAEKELKALDPPIALKIGSKLLELESNPTPSQSKRLQSSKFYSLKIGKIRVIYSIIHADKMINILAVGYRDSIYKRLKRL